MDFEFHQRLADLVKAGTVLSAAIDQAAPLLGRPVTLKDIQNARNAFPLAFPLAYKKVY